MEIMDSIAPWRCVESRAALYNSHLWWFSAMFQPLGSISSIWRFGGLSRRGIKMR